ncbi:MAG: thiamine phosphate synthase [Actinomycetota bacterium]
MEVHPDVYVLTSDGLVPGRGHLDVVRAAIEGGATMLQLRAPDLPDPVLQVTARAFAELCRTAGIPGIVNDRIDVAISSGATGVHLGQEDGPHGARRMLGSERILGISVSDVAQAREAEDFDADYLGVVVWSTGTKPQAKPVGVAGLRAIAAATKLPVVGIGGIDATNAGEVLGAGAAGIAVVSSVGAAYDPVAATRSLVRVVAARSGGGASRPDGAGPAPSGEQART